MTRPCDDGSHEAPSVCWSTVERTTTALAKRSALTRCVRVTALPDPSGQCWRPTPLPGRGAGRMYGADGPQHDSCLPRRDDRVLASQILSPQERRAGTGRSQARTASGHRPRKPSLLRQADQPVDASASGPGLLRVVCDAPPAQRRVAAPRLHPHGRFLEASQTLDHESRPGIRAQKKFPMRRCRTPFDETTGEPA